MSNIVNNILLYLVKLLSEEILNCFSIKNYKCWVFEYYRIYIYIKFVLYIVNINNYVLIKMKLMYFYNLIILIIKYYWFIEVI